MESVTMKNINFPLVSIIVVNWNGGEVFRDLLKSLSKITYSNWELIVVDNGSTDGSFQLPSNIKLIRNRTNLGFARANNQGYKISKGEYTLLLNNDTRVSEDFLGILVNRMKSDPSIGVIQPKIFLMDNPKFLDNAGSFLTRIGFLQHWGFMEKDGLGFNKEREIFSAKGACMLIRREVIEKVGLFDDDFFAYFEESDFCWRVWMNGWRVLFFPKAVVYHKLGFTIRRLDVTELNYHYYKNRICSLLKNLETKNLIVIFGLHFFISLALSFLFLLRGHSKYSMMMGKALFWNIWNLGSTFIKRSQIQRMRKRSDRQLFKLIIHPINWKKFLRDFKRLEEDLDRKV